MTTRPVLGKAIALEDILGTQVTIRKGDSMDVYLQFPESGNYLVGIDDKAVYAEASLIELV